MAPSLQQEVRKQQPFETSEQEAYLNLVRTAHHLTTFEDRFMRRYGLSGSKYNVLRILRGIGGEGAQCSAIRARMIARVPDITRLIDRLEQDGLATRHRVDRDRRVVLIRLTPKALDLLAEMDQPLLEMHREQLGHMSREELATLSQLLERARESVRGSDGKGGSLEEP